MQILGKCQFLIVISIFFFTNQLELYMAFILFALIHELGHLIVGVALGEKIEKIQILPMGVNVSFKILVDDYNKKIIKGTSNNVKNLIIAIAGPFVNFTIAIIFYNLNRVNIWGKIKAESIIYINLLIGFFNLIPIFPLDGGRIVKEILYILFGKKDALEIVNKVSNITMIMLTILASISILIVKNIAILFIILFLWGLVIKENKKYNTLKKIYALIEKINL